MDGRMGDPREGSRFRSELERLYREGVIDGISLVAADAEACRACLSVADRSYTPWELPNLPVEGCTSPGGCRCRYEPNVTVYE
jgi:hypothetical protein